ncbi:agmatine deiminase family protein [Lichenifustis flavocetrariae]|uniref:Putative agmatine deiminase n=1 Tax=Lichenifustis flavocetrariae TaxID=2949735 RepID=A0AA42CIT2_9HYPH|nr:agmatine deiminase family protein [Lichenifustis flavocetrariae]MCW6507216.1 agmatine deiminase family protein [Lichenifustis flavocetrariae]
MTGASESGLRMPAEWAPHERCWMAWPCRPEGWRNGLGPAREALAAVVRAIARFEPVTLLVRPEDLDEAARLTRGAAELVATELDDSWTRDTGPTFVQDRDGQLAGIDWGFNGWGLVYPGFARDARLARHILGLADARRIVGPQILEGGSIHVDGEGTLLTTEQCLLDPQRNPHLDKADIEANLTGLLGIDAVVWLPRGLTGDETRGHVDNLCCFFKPGHVLLPALADRADPDWAVLAEARAVLERSVDAKGRRFTILELPTPPRRRDKRGELMALSYVNFYVANGAIVMPGFDAASDREAARVLKAAFPDREIVVVPGHGIADGGGNIHCITQQQPRAAPAG